MEIRRAFKRAFLALLTVLLLLLVIVLPQRIAPNLSSSSDTFIDFPDVLSPGTYDWDSIADLVSVNKGFEHRFEKQAMIALSAYPELREVKINFVLTDGGAPMESSFELLTLLGNRKNRVYEIRLSDAEDSMFEGILMRNLPFDAQVGILAHELGHVLYYEQMSTMQIAKWGIMYLVSIDFRTTHEKSTDLIPIGRGLGAQLYHYAWYVRHQEENQSLYAKWGQFMDMFYLTDEEILQEWSSFETIDFQRLRDSLVHKTGD